jgi:hypothetical protein
MPRKIEEAEQAKPPLGSIRQSARELNSAERLLTPKDAANFLRLSPSWLAKARMRGDGPPYVKVGRRSIRYRGDALVQLLKSRARQSTPVHQGRRVVVHRVRGVVRVAEGDLRAF